MACSFENVEDGFQWAFAGVYGPNIDVERRSLWEELAGLLSWWELPSCIGGDYNVSRFPIERSSRTHITLAIRDFPDFITEQALMDIPLTMGTYTWSNTCELPFWPKTDRFLLTLDWELHFPDVTQRRLPRIGFENGALPMISKALQVS
ncbi:hypothetical protein F2P56_034912 [Juglans regia]|uniref:Endonuclease/exonuclease/phosphatase domain-containing protein n=1 Tax=Juglans regia TaxID=51240 RepID=A0A833TI66_JUGRE|nr:hypothetical protein F2P56_034912 [Juglans regia]